MADETKRPSFVESWLDDLKEDYQNRGFRALIPIWVIVFGACGCTVGYYVPAAFWVYDTGNMIEFYGALVTVNGLILALSWSAFSTTFQAMGALGFSTYLRQSGILGTTYFHIQYVHLTQIAALTVSIIALILSIFALPSAIIDQCALGASVATLGYSLRYAVGAVTIMKDVSWYKVIYDEKQQREQKESENVVDMNSQR